MGFCWSLTYGNFSPEVITKVKELALDFIGVAARGSLTDSARAARRMVEEMGRPQGEGVLIGAEGRAPFYLSAFSNGVAAHSLELDDVNNESSLHPGAVIFPVAFAMGEFTHCDGRRFIEGVVSGYEVMVRLGEALRPARHYARGFHPTGTCGAFGAAATASRVLGLGPEETVNALGIAGSQASGLMEFLATGAWTKRMHPGWAASAGIVASLLGKVGFKGPSTVIEGRFGFLRAYSDGPDPERVLKDLGAPLKVMRTSLKPHACCRYKQGPIDGILKIMGENGLRADEIERVEVGMLGAGMPIVAEPAELKYNPRTVVDAQFSMPFGAAVAILYGRASIDEYTQERIASEEVKEMMRRVSCIHDPKLDEEYPERWPATVRIRTRDGREFFTKVNYPKGDPENPLSWEELVEKFRYLTSPVYSEGRREEIILRVRSLEAEEDISDFTALLGRE